MKNTFKQIAFCGLLFSCGLWACSDSATERTTISSLEFANGLEKNTSNNNKPKIDKKTDAQYLKVANERKSTRWFFDANTNDIIDSTYEDGDIILVLNDFPLIDNPKKTQPTANIPLAEINDEKGAYAKRLTINGRLVEGTMIGIFKEKIVLEIYFSAGLRCGSYFGITNKGKEIRMESDNQCINEKQMMRKPVIYLYPTKTQVVNVKVDLKGSLTHTYPKYPADGWTVTAAPNGELVDVKTSKVYYQLFWEGQSDYQYKMDKGFVIKGSETANFLDDKLAALGLNRREANEFITYWLPELEKNEYNFIHFAGSEYEEQAKLKISPAADTKIRIFMVYKPLKAWQAIEEQKLEAVPRKGFTVVEWGGKLQMETVN